MTKSIMMLMLIMLIGAMLLMLINVQSLKTCIMVPLISPAMASKATEMFNLEINSFSSSCQPSLQGQLYSKGDNGCTALHSRIPNEWIPFEILERYGKGPPWRWPPHAWPPDYVTALRPPPSSPKQCKNCVCCPVSLNNCQVTNIVLNSGSQLSDL